MKIMLKSSVFILLFLIGCVCPGLAEGLKLSGKLRLLVPSEIKVTSVDGEEMLAVTVENGREFSVGPKKIVPDVYILSIGETKQPIYLTNTEVTIKGYYDAQKPENSSLEFTGIDAFVELARWIPTELSERKRVVSPEVKGKLKGSMYSALAYLAEMTQYEPNKMLLDLVPPEVRNVASAQWLRRRVDSLGRFAVGAEAYDFEFPNPEGEKVRLSDFRGKFVLVDFWASWCGSCRQEAKKLLPIYEKLKGEDLVFVSVSLDKREQDWRRLLNEERLPWLMLWDAEGFTIGNEPNEIQKAYGFYSIPFIVLIDKEGRIAARDLRGGEVRDAIVKARMGK